MKIIIDICHPAHVHFFCIPYLKLIENKHDVLVTSRNKDVTLQLLEEKNIKNTCISSAPDSPSINKFIKELISREKRLLKIVKSFKPDIITGIGGIFAAHVAKLSKAKSIVFYDTENATIQNLLTYPFTNKLFVPQCYSGWTPRNRTVRYNGYHELSYLHPNYFKPDKEIAIKNGVDVEKKNIFLRVVSWNANHDINEIGWSNEFLEEVISLFSAQTNIIISTERPLAQKFSKFLYKGNTSELHHVLAHCDLYLGESATIASEGAVMGIPSIYIANTSRGYIDEQQNKYNLVKIIKTFDLEKIHNAINYFLFMDHNAIKKQHKKLISDSIDVAEMVYTVLTKN